MKGKTTASPYLSVAAVANYFGVSASSIYKARGVFAALRFVPINGRRMMLRSSVEELDQHLQQPAQPADEGLRLVKKRA